MRNYLVFGSNDDGETLKPLGVFEAPDHDQARKLARTNDYKSYGSTPVGNWSFGTLKVKEVVDIEEQELPLPNTRQMTVHEAVSQARDALDE